MHACHKYERQFPPRNKVIANLYLAIMIFLTILSL